MVFSSLSFIFIFLPAFIITYIFSPVKLRNAVIFLASLIFYFIGCMDTPEAMLLLLAAVILNYFFARVISALSGRKRKLLFILSVGYNLGWLIFFKYSAFLLSFFNIHIPFFTELRLPIGISFYTFQCISYLADVYRKKICAERSVLMVGTYLTMYPQLVAGPIVTYPEVRGQLLRRKFNIKQLARGFAVFSVGLGYKVLLADRIGGLWNNVVSIGADSISVPLAWMGAFSYTFKIYFDFCGYSVMAVGLGKMFGFRLPQNFRLPYMAKTMTDFFRRWHITLGAFFREYVYIPLGGNRRGYLRMFFNLLVVWLLTGLWHGAGFNFILWGAVIFILISVEKLGIGKLFEAHPLAGHLYMTLAVPLTWVIFACDDMTQLKIYFGRLFGASTDGVIFKGDYIKYGKQYGLIFIICIIFSTPLPRRLLMRIKNKYVRYAIIFAFFIMSVMCLQKSNSDPFMYFRF